MEPFDIVSREEWLVARKRLLDLEKQATRARDALSAARRALPMVRVDADYVFEGPMGDVGLIDLFEGRGQLIVHHFMFDPAWENGCGHCTSFANNGPYPPELHDKDISYVMVSRAPFEKLEAYRHKMGWTYRWYSSSGSMFNYDFQVTADPAVAPITFNYRTIDELREAGVTGKLEGEHPGVSVFIRDGNSVFHTYSAYARGVEPLHATVNFLDLTPLGRQGS